LFFLFFGGANLEETHRSGSDRDGACAPRYGCCRAAEKQKEKMGGLGSGYKQATPTRFGSLPEGETYPDLSKMWGNAKC